MSQNIQLVDTPDYWIIPISGRTVSRCIVDYAFSIESFEEAANIVTIRVSGNFHFKTSHQEYLLSADQPTALGPVFSILHKTFESVLAYKTGKLEIKFLDASYLSVDFDPNYEAWEISGVGDLQLVCLPGGGLAIWQPS